MNANSRYAINRLVTLRGSDGKIRNTIIPNFPAQLLFNYTYYKWNQIDRIDLVSYDFYGNEQSWWMIGEANPEILDWTTIPIGTVIRIPSVK
jgi:hypothetical protein